jgi:uncharacterized protein YeaO (DUF488 family)
MATACWSTGCGRAASRGRTRGSTSGRATWAPSDSLRRWYGHDVERFEEFRRRYIEELAERRHRLTELRRRARQGRLTLVFAARDAEHSNAEVLASVLRRGLR